MEKIVGNFLFRVNPFSDTINDEIIAEFGKEVPWLALIGECQKTEVFTNCEIDAALAESLFETITQLATDLRFREKWETLTGMTMKGVENG